MHDKHKCATKNLQITTGHHGFRCCIDLKQKCLRRVAQLGLTLIPSAIELEYARNNCGESIAHNPSARISNVEIITYLDFYGQWHCLILKREVIRSEFSIWNCNILIWHNGVICNVIWLFLNKISYYLCCNFIYLNFCPRFFYLCTNLNKTLR